VSSTCLEPSAQLQQDGCTYSYGKICLHAMI